MGTLRKGDLVEVRSKEEVLSTLDNDGLLDGLPFMPEMLTYCGQRYRVGAVAHKTCDTVGKTGGRRLESAVHLEDLRCDGSAHGGCEADCLMFWKEAWLRPVEPARAQRASAMTSRAGGCSEAQLRAAVYAHGAALRYSRPPATS